MSSIADADTADGTATTAGTDYTAVATSTVTFLATETTKTQAVATLADASIEGVEKFDLGISNLAGTDTARGSIDTDRNTAMIYIFDQSCKFTDTYFPKYLECKADIMNVESPCGS